jgi:hypothetical protein
MNAPKKLTLAALAAAFALLLLASAGNAAVTFGSRLNNNPANSNECQGLVNPGPCTIASFIEPSAPNGDPYSGGAPIDGVITKFRIRAFGEAIGMDPDPSPAQVTFRLANVTPDPNDNSSALAVAAGTGPTVTIPADDGGDAPILTFPARVPVAKGQQLAIDGTNVAATHNDSGDKFSYVFAPPLVDGQGARGSTDVTGELLVQADIEADADHDGFGDETQDQCPTQATTQGPCDTAAPAVSGLRVSGRKLFYKLSEGASVSFRLQKAVTGRKVRGKCVRKTKRNRRRAHCRLVTNLGGAFAGPGAAGANQLTLRKLTAGRYRLTMTVTDAVGNSATNTTSFTVKPPKKKHKKRH